MQVALGASCFGCMLVKVTLGPSCFGCKLQFMQHVHVGKSCFGCKLLWVLLVRVALGANYLALKLQVVIGASCY